MSDSMACIFTGFVSCATSHVAVVPCRGQQRSPAQRPATRTGFQLNHRKNAKWAVCLVRAVPVHMSRRRAKPLQATGFPWRMPFFAWTACRHRGSQSQLKGGQGQRSQGEQSQRGQRSQGSQRSKGREEAEEERQPQKTFWQKQPGAQRARSGLHTE